MDFELGEIERLKLEVITSSTVFDVLAEYGAEPAYTAVMEWVPTESELVE
jgi:hypothetical protein